MTDSELEELHTARKAVQEAIRWYSNGPDTIRTAEADVWVVDASDLTFRAQCTMRLFLKVVMPVRPKRLNYYYLVKTTGQIVRMYHSDAHHDDLTGLIPGPHKHVFESDRRRRAYPVADIRSKIMLAIQDFFKEENISTSEPVETMRSDPTLAEFGT